MIQQKMELILDALERAQQRATYGAVASAVNSSPRSLMRGRTRDRRHSWIVNRATGLPSGYPPDTQHPHLLSNPDIIATPQDLEALLVRLAT